MGRSPCCEKNGLKKGPWTQEEDQKLIDYIQKNGYGHWRILPKNAGLQRCGKSCRLRWTNYLRPDIKRGRFSFEEEETIIQLHSILGNKWSAIAARLPGRTDNEIKNYWNTHIRKRLLRMGIDPVTHAPRLDLLDLSALLTYSSLNPLNQIYFSRLHQQTLINPQLLRFATSLLSPHQQTLQSGGFIPPQMNPQISNQSLVQPGHEVQPSNFDVMNSMKGQGDQIMQYDAVQGLEQHNYGQLSNEWQQNSNNDNETAQLSALTTEDYLQMPNYGDYYGSDQSGAGQDPSSETSAFQSNNFSFQSGLSTPSSSPTPLHSAYNVYSSSSNATAEDDREISYGSNILDFEIPDILDVNEFM